jgi:hypothetical protein
MIKRLALNLVAYNRASARQPGDMGVLPLRKKDRYI